MFTISASDVGIFVETIQAYREKYFQKGLYYVSKLLIMKGYLMFFTILSFIASVPVKGQTEIGLQLYSLRNEFKTDVPGTLAMLKEWGITEIEGGETYGLSMNEFRKLLKDNELRMISVGADYNQLRDDPQSAVAKAKAFGAKYVVCFWIPHENDVFTLDDAKKAVNVFNKAGKLMAENGLSLCYHPHGYEFRPYEGGTLFDYLAEKTDARFVSFEMDVFWVKHPGQDPVALLNKYSGRFPLMHLKDRKPGTPGNQHGRADVESNVVLGTGDVGIAEIMRAGKRAGVKHYFIEDESSRSVTQIPESLEYLEQFDKQK